MSNSWDDIRYVLAVAEQGSLSAAARALGVNHATVLRRINRFEDASGVTLFDRSARGVRLAANRRKVLDGMRDMHEAAAGIKRALTATQSAPAGKVRITATDTFCLAVLPPILSRIMEMSEALQIELNSANQHVSLAELDADIAIRPAQSLPDNLVGQRAGRLGFAAYGSHTGATGWLGMSGALVGSLPAQWLAAISPDSINAASADSFVVLREMVAAGQGRALLPVVLGESDARLVRFETKTPPDMSVPIWVASHKDLADVPRIKLVRDVLISALQDDAARIRG